MWEWMWDIMYPIYMGSWVIKRFEQGVEGDNLQVLQTNCSGCTSSPWIWHWFFSLRHAILWVTECIITRAPIAAVSHMQFITQVLAVGTSAVIATNLITACLQIVHIGFHTQASFINFRYFPSIHMSLVRLPTRCDLGTWLIMKAIYYAYLDCPRFKQTNLYDSMLQMGRIWT